MRTPKVFLGVLCVVLFFVSGVAVPDEAHAARRCFTQRAGDKRLVRDINARRNRRGTRRLVLDRHLSRVSARHVQEMAGRGRLFRSPRRILKRRVLRERRLGQHIAVGRTWRSARMALLRSPSFRHDMRSGRFRHVG